MVSPEIQLYSFGSSQIIINEPWLTNVINKGYNIPRYKYGIITSSRIKNGFRQCFGLTDINDSYICFLFAPSHLENVNEAISVNDHDDGLITKKKLIERYKNTDLNLTKWELKIDNSVKDSVPNDDLNLPIGEDFNNRFLGMTCLKPHEGTYEVTGFISFYPKAGTLLMKFNDYLAFELLKTSSVWVTAIYEHELTSMYEKFGYEFIRRDLVPIVSSTPEKTDLLEDGIGASQDFHLDIMIKRA